MKQKIYETTKPKEDKNKISFTVKVDYSKLSNPEHHQHKLNSRAIIFEDKRKKKPKYKPNDLDY